MKPLGTAVKVALLSYTLSFHVKSPKMGFPIVEYIGFLIDSPTL